MRKQHVDVCIRMQERKQHMATHVLQHTVILRACEDAQATRRRLHTYARAQATHGDVTATHCLQHAVMLRACADAQATRRRLHTYARDRKQHKRRRIV